MNTEEMDFTDARMLRKKAEQKLKEKQKQLTIDEKEADVKKLLHELQVHQIELEMQNEELRQAYDIAESALKKYTILYDFSPMGYFTLDPECNISDLNFTGAEMLGEKRFRLIRSNFKLFISQDSIPVFNEFFRKVYTSNIKESCEVMLGNDDNSSCLVYMEGIVTDEDPKCLLAVVDISGFRNRLLKK